MYLCKMDLTGKKIGMLTVIKFEGTDKGNRLWRVKCECGVEKTIKRKDLTKKNHVQSCGCLRNKLLSQRTKGSAHYNWNGGVTINGKGYLEYKYGELRGKRVHRHIYEQHYGIQLLPHQNIHHINGDKLDNRIENLELWDTSQPSGQRVEDKIKYYFELVEKYKDHPKYKELINNL